MDHFGLACERQSRDSLAGENRTATAWTRTKHADRRKFNQTKVRLRERRNPVMLMVAA
jgi:hypothetical protein